MKTVTINHRYTNAVLFSCEVEDDDAYPIRSAIATRTSATRTSAARTSAPRTSAPRTSACVDDMIVEWMAVRGEGELIAEVQS